MKTVTTPLLYQPEGQVFIYDVPAPALIFSHILKAGTISWPVEGVTNVGVNSYPVAAAQGGTSRLVFLFLFIYRAAMKWLPFSLLPG